MKDLDLVVLKPYCVSMHQLEKTRDIGVVLGQRLARKRSRSI